MEFQGRQGISTAVFGKYIANRGICFPELNNFFLIHALDSGRFRNLRGMGPVSTVWGNATKAGSQDDGALQACFMPQSARRAGSVLCETSAPGAHKKRGEARASPLKGGYRFAQWLLICQLTSLIVYSQ
jgi:hypothetical protein